MRSGCGRLFVATQQLLKRIAPTPSTAQEEQCSGRRIRNALADRPREPSTRVTLPPRVQHGSGAAAVELLDRPVLAWSTKTCPKGKGRWRWSPLF